MKAAGPPSLVMSVAWSCGTKLHLSTSEYVKFGEHYLQ
jgi:hypothetical protein